jgi:hypothetical protein
MKLFVAVVLVAMNLTALGQAPVAKPKKVSALPNTLTPAEKKIGWVLLFDGKTTAGWHTFNKKTIGSAWKVANGALYLDTSRKEGWQVKGGGDIVTEKEYENFHFKMEWKISPAGNSGIIFLVKEDPKYKHAWLTGPEMQIVDNNGHSDGKIIKHKAGDLYDLIASSKESAKPAGEWNQVEIICNKGKLNFFLNGVNVVSTTLWNEEWKKMVARSKFIEMPDFGTYTSGRIALQDHGNLVWFRNIKIKKL